MSTTITTAHSTTTASSRRHPTASRLAGTPVSIVVALAGLAGAVVVFGYAALAEALSVPMHAGSVGASHADPIPPASFSMGVVTCTILGGMIAMALARWAKHPARTFVRVTVALTAISLAFPVIASHTEVSTRITLELAHVIAALVVIPPITRRLSSVNRHAVS